MPDDTLSDPQPGKKDAESSAAGVDLAPFTVEPFGHSGVYEIRDRYGREVATVCIRGPKWSPDLFAVNLANALLFVAAPDLLQSLKSARSHIANNSFAGGPSISPILAQIDAAITKAGSTSAASDDAARQQPKKGFEEDYQSINRLDRKKKSL